jgi:predicted MFS family arabinose efflux permease
MIRWAAHHIGWLAIRIAVTLACCWTVNNVIAEEGYRVAFYDLLIVAACLIVLMRFWMPRPYEKKVHKETTFTE